MRGSAFAGPILLLLAAAWPAPLAATTYVAVPDGRLADQAELIVAGTVRERRPVAGAAEPLTEYALEVEQALKGRAGGRIAVRVPGGEREDGVTMLVWGAPDFARGERVLLFLLRHADGSYRPLHLMLGAFHEVAADGRRLAVRDLSEAAEVGAAGAPRPEPARDFRRFSRWLADRAAGLRRAPDYLVELPAPARTAIAERFTYIGGTKTRWFEFDRRQSVGWRAHERPLPGFPGGGFAQFRTAIAAWNDDRASNVLYRYDGTTAASQPSGNHVFFVDPGTLSFGTFSCSAPGSGSGVLATAAVAFSTRGPPPWPIVFARVTVNDGADCWMTSGKRLEMVLGHELGHTLGLGHSCGDLSSGPCDTLAKSEALMRSFAHRDERGARLGEDDLAGIRSLYPALGLERPAAPSGLTATAVSSGSVAVAWVDNSPFETQVRIEMKTAGAGAFHEVLRTEANATAALVGDVEPETTYTFRVRGRNRSGFSPYSNEATATTPAAPRPPAAPSGLVAEPVSATEIRLTWQDRASDEMEVLVEQSSPAGTFARIAALPAGATTFAAGGLTAETPYTFRVHARNAYGASPLSNLASATTAGDAGPCTAGAEALCLLAARFRVLAHWRDTAGANGRGNGTLLAGSDQVGLFSFFDAGNVELIVKLLDGQGANGFFWTFYGGLSTVEYWITVVDTASGASRTYHNPAGSLCGGGDVKSLPGAEQGAEAGAAGLVGGVAGRAAIAPPAAAKPAATTACAPGALCLLGGRFQVEATWRLPGAAGAGAGTPVPLHDGAGLFWFFDPANVELVAKVLDGRALNGKFWFFYGALSNVEYDLRVTDTGTGAVRTYHNPPGSLCGGADTGAFDG